MMELTEEWTEEKCIQLIRAFRAKPILWDPKDQFYFKKALKPGAWQDIAKILDIPTEECRHKMTILMSSFRREKSKIMNSLKNNLDPSKYYHSSWFAFKEMAFLMDKKSERKRRLEGNETEEEDEEDDNARRVKKTLLKHHIQPPISTTATSMMSKKRFQIKRDSLMKDYSVNSSQPDPGPNQTPDERDEEIKSFITFIGNKMKRYSDVTKNAVQQEICSIIFKADRNSYETNTGTDFSLIDRDSDPLNESLEFDNMQDNITIKIQSSDSDDQNQFTC